MPLIVEERRAMCTMLNGYTLGKSGDTITPG